MPDIRPVTSDFAVAPQLSPDDLLDAARSGFRLIINNRPDGEAPDQPSAAEMGAAAAHAGLRYVHIPVRGGPTPADIAAVAAAISDADGPVLAFCRSGTRSIITWALGQAARGADKLDLLAAGRSAGYDLSAVLS
jgi:uncharacterized protein (TIGR01244 family)